MIDCKHPDLKPWTSYRKGCRCDRCRAGNAAKARAYRASHAETYNAYQRRYFAHPEQRARQAARQAVYRAIQAGRLTPEPCGQCGAEPAEAHHEDYSKPLCVAWLCKLCHTSKHQGRAS